MIFRGWCLLVFWFREWNTELVSFLTSRHLCRNLISCQRLKSRVSLLPVPTSEISIMTNCVFKTQKFYCLIFLHNMSTPFHQFSTSYGFKISLWKLVLTVWKCFIKSWYSGRGKLSAGEPRHANKWKFATLMNDPLTSFDLFSGEIANWRWPCTEASELVRHRRTVSFMETFENFQTNSLFQWLTTQNFQ